MYLYGPGIMAGERERLRGKVIKGCDYVGKGRSGKKGKGCMGRCQRDIYIYIYIYMIIPGYRSGQTHRLVDNIGRHE